MISILVLGLLIGMRHALEADHLAAVASLVAGSGSPRAAAVRGAAWGLGHSLTLSLVGGVCLLLDVGVPEGFALAAEAAVGAVLVLLGADVLRRLRHGGVHVHAHRHADGTVHLHAHAHPQGEEHPPGTMDDPAPHQDAHALPRRAILVGLLHGMAGSAALLLLTLQTVGSVWLGLAYIGLFGLGSILGMALLSAAIAMPLSASARAFGGRHRGLEGAVGATTVAVGLWTLCRAAGL